VEESLKVLDIAELIALALKQDDQA
jgi:hypothetical protein